MRPYKTIRFTEGPDVGDIHAEGRRTAVGRIKRGTAYKGKVVHNDRGYVKSVAKAATRRILKRRDRGRVERFERLAER